MLKLVNTLAMFVQKSLFYETTVLVRKRKAHWAVTEVIFRDEGLSGADACESEAGRRCSVSLCRAAGAKAPRAPCATFPGWQLLP